jgi:hypothetical protein
MPASDARPSVGAMSEQRSRAASHPARHGGVAECHIGDDKIFQVALATEAIQHANLGLVIRLCTTVSVELLRPVGRGFTWVRIFEKSSTLNRYSD